jgi:hypothetical protein
LDTVVTQPSSSRIHPEDEHLTDVQDGDTDLESADDWLSEPDTAEPGGKLSSKALDVMLTEVGHSFFLVSPYLQVLL